MNVKCWSPLVTFHDMQVALSCHHSVQQICTSNDCSASILTLETTLQPSCDEKATYPQPIQRSDFSASHECVCPGWINEFLSLVNIHPCSTQTSDSLVFVEFFFQDIQGENTVFRHIQHSVPISKVFKIEVTTIHSSS